MSTLQIDFGGGRRPPIIGIDLGTTNSLVAVMELTGPRILSGIVPSVVAVAPNGEVIAGAEARDMLLTHPERAMYVFGPEDGSLPSTLLERCDDVVFIPTKHCLNLSMAANIVLYDRMAKRGEWTHEKVGSA